MVMERIVVLGNGKVMCHWCGDEIGRNVAYLLVVFGMDENSELSLVTKTLDGKIQVQPGSKQGGIKWKSQ